jgi:hypothetical protein
MASGGQFRLIRTNAKGIKGSGPNGEVDFHDLFDGNLQDGWKPKYPDRVKDDKIIHNKFTKRMLSRMLHETLIGHGQNYNVSDITYSNTINPAAAFVMFSDHTVQGKQGDYRPEFDESDGQFVSVLSSDTTTAGEGRRGITLSDTSGILKRVSIAYRSTSPYGEAEYVFYAQPNTAAQETGNDGIDNFPIKAVGLAAGVACGDGEANSQIGIRAIVGLAPTWQGISDRVYVHEGQAENVDLIPEEYPYDGLSGGAVAGNEGYIQSSALARVQIDNTSTPSGAVTDSITAGTQRIVLANAVTDLPTTGGFVQDVHQRKVIEIANSGIAGNNRKYTIKKVISTTEVETFEAPAGDDDGSSNPFTASIYEEYEGFNAFDGRIENEGRVEAADHDPPGVVIHGETWSSEDSAGTHTLGRIFGTNKTLIGIRIVIPRGVNKDFVPEDFTIQILDPAANSGNPRPGFDADWTTVSSGVRTGQAGNIFGGGMYGYEYTFDAISARGIRLTGMQAFSSSRFCKIAAFMAFEAMSAVTLDNSTDVLKIKTKGPSSYRDFAPDDVTATQSVSDLTSALNFAIRGYELEAVRSTFGFLWLRGTVAGDNSDAWMDAETAAGTNTKLGLPSGATQRTGITQSITKAPEDALTILYRINITGNVSGGWV